MESRFIHNKGFRMALVIPAISILLLTASSALGAGGSKTYTLDADFDEGTLINVNHDAPYNDQLQLDSVATPFEFIWVAASSRGTVVKINTSTGAILGEYRTTPSSHGGGNPSRTTVDNDGSVWVANRANVFGGLGSVLHIGLEENGQCEDRNNNAVIDTSTGLSDIKAWTDASGARNVGTAADECIVHYTMVSSAGTRHVSVDANNDVWVSGTSIRNFDLVKGGRYDVPLSGTVTRTESSVGYGGYGGLIDGNGVIWSARNLLRWDTANPLSGPNGYPGGLSIGPPAAGTDWSGHFFDSYGLCIDVAGNVWNTQLSGDLIRKYAPDGTFLGAFAHGNHYAQGCVADANGDIWVAHSLFSATTVGHLLNDGTHVGNVPLPGGNGPTGVAVDAAGKVWAANINTSNVSRIDPTAGPIGGGGVPIGAVDLTVALGPGAGPYNYSDMTGSTLIAPPNSGTWAVVYDSGEVSAPWREVSWNSSKPGDSSIVVTVAGSTDGVTTGPFKPVANGGEPSFDSQFLHINVAFARSSGGDSPILFDLTALWNHDPDCSLAAPSIDTLWPPNHKFVPVNVLGVTDPDGDPITITIDSIWQDEPVDTLGDGTFAPDGIGVGTAMAEVRAERSGNPNVPGNGRVYHIGFTAADALGGSCSGAIMTGVPHDKNDTPVDDGALFDSTIF